MQSTVLSVVSLTESAFVLRIARNGLVFKAGQYIVLGFSGERMAREYSIFSAEQDDYLDVLIKEVDSGEMSQRLKALSAGDAVEVAGPFGFFVLSDREISGEQPVVFVATGTGVSPFRSMVRSYAGLDYTLLHGVRHMQEAYHCADYDTHRYKLCVSREKGSAWPGRVSNYLSEYAEDPKACYYLCGNSAMIDDVCDILERKGIQPDQIKTEVFF